MSSDVKKPSVADTLYDMALGGFRFADSPSGLVAMDQSPDWPVALPMRTVGAILAHRFYIREGRVPSMSAVKNALNAVEGSALSSDSLGECDPQPRVARAAEAKVVVDMLDGTGRAAVITPRGVELAHAPTRTSVVFTRTPAMGALPEPDLTVDPADLPALLASLLNMSDDGVRLVVGWLVAALIPDISHPVLVLRGEQGTAKSTAARILTRIIDPGPAPLRQPPKDVDAWTTSASSSWVVCLDNVSRLTHDVSDALCRAVTGDGIVKRSLYSNNDAFVITMRRAVLMTTIEAGATRGDLAERSLVINLTPIGERRVGEREIEALFQELHPQLLGGLMLLCGRVLGMVGKIKLEHAPRMADFAMVLAAVDEALGWDGASLTSYIGTLAQSHLDVIEGNPVAQKLIAYLEEAGEWHGSPSELLAAIEARFGDHSRPPDWPKNGRGLTGALVRLNPALRGVGWEYAEAPRTKHSRMCTVKRVPIPEG